MDNPKMSREQAQVENSFTYHPPQPNQIPRYGALRAQGYQMALVLMELVPPSRERSLAITKLEECIMWANKGIACNESETKRDGA